MILSSLVACGPEAGSGVVGCRSLVVSHLCRVEKRKGRRGVGCRTSCLHYHPAAVFASSTHPFALQPPGASRVRTGMIVRDLHEDTRGAVQPALHTAFATYPHGAPQAVGDGVAECVGLRVVSFNLGMPQAMMEWRRWSEHVRQFRDVLQSLGHAAGNDFIFCSEVGDPREGFNETTVDHKQVVLDPFPGAACASCYAYLHVWNVRNQAAILVRTGMWSNPTAHATDMLWQAFDLNYRDATQLADNEAPELATPKVGLLVGNMHIPAGGSHSPTPVTRRRIVQEALNHLTRLEVQEWRDRRNFPVVRLLVGDCNLEKQAAEAVTQTLSSPALTALQRDLDVRKWQVRDVQFRDRLWEPHGSRIHSTIQHFPGQLLSL